MIESFALLNSRIAKRPDDDYPEFTEALFEVLYPHYPRPFPSCSIARMDFAGAATQLTTASVVARGTELKTLPVRGAACTFRAAYPVTVAPLGLAAASFAAIIDAPEAVRLTAATSGMRFVRCKCGNGRKTGRTTSGVTFRYRCAIIRATSGG